MLMYARCTMGEAATAWAFEGGGLADIPAVKLRLVRASTHDLDEQDRAMLDLLEVSFVRRWAEAFADVAPERADLTAVRLWSAPDRTRSERTSGERSDRRSVEA